VFDINFNRVPRAACQEARRRRNLPPLPLQEAGKPATLNVLFCRDLTAERDGSLYYPKLPPKPSVDQILKTMSIYELHGLNDIAVDTAIKFSSELGQRLDVERAVDLLCRRSNFLPGLEERISDLQCELARAASGRVQLDGEHIRELARLTSERDQLNGERIALTEEVSQMRASTSWRMTAPLRSLVHRFRQTMR
jgi:hypothetical protein